MEDKNKMTEEEKHKTAYYELKDIQHQYGFENIAKLREFYVRLGNVFKDFDPPEESTRGSEILNILHDAFTFFSKIDDIEDSKIQEEYDSLEEKMLKDNVSPYVINAINSYYNSRINSEIEKIRKRIIKGEKNLEEAINNYYINRWELKLIQWEDRYTKTIINTLNFAFNFPTYHTNWNDGNNWEKLFFSLDLEIPQLILDMEMAKIPEPIINTFITHAKSLNELRKQAEYAIRQNER